MTPGVARQSRLLEPGQLVEMFQLDLTLLGGAVLYYHNYATPGGGAGNVVFQGNTYVQWPIKGDGWDRTTKGTLPRPTIAVDDNSTCSPPNPDTTPAGIVIVSLADGLASPYAATVSGDTSISTGITSSNASLSSRNRAVI